MEFSGVESIATAVDLVSHLVLDLARRRRSGNHASVSLKVRVLVSSPVDPYLVSVNLGAE